MTRDDESNPRRTAAIAAAVLTGALALMIAVTTPWRPLPGDGPDVPVDPALDFTAAEITRSRDFDSALAPPAYLGLVVGLLVILALGLTPLGARLIGLVTDRTGVLLKGRVIQKKQERADQRTEPSAPVAGQLLNNPPGRWPLKVAGAALTLSLVLRIVDMPFDAWRETILRRYGLSTQDWGSWALDQARSFGVTAVIWLVALLGLFLLIRRFPRHWWAGAAAGGFVLVVVASFVYPVVFEPVFNDFKPMAEGQQRDDLLDLAERDGVDVSDVLVADASRRTTALNAYVSGFGSTRRIVVYDNLLKSPPAEVETVVAHELGHAKRNDVLHGTLIGALGVAAGVCFLYLLMTSRRCQRRAGVARASDPRALALLLAGVTVLGQLAGPVQNLVSRRIEARADVHALDLTRDPATFVAMQHQLSVRNISDLDPDPMEYVLWASHPSGPQRIAMARTWAVRHNVPVPGPLVQR